MSNTEPIRRSFLDRLRRPSTTQPAPTPPDPELADRLRAAAEDGIIDGLHPDSSIEWEDATADGLDVSTYAENVIENLAYDRRELTREPEQLITAARIAGEYRAQWNGRDEAVTAAAEDLYAAVHATAGTTPDHTLHDLYRTATDNPGRANTAAAGEPERLAASVEVNPATGQGQTLQQRMEAEYLAGYDDRIRTGLAYATADATARAAAGEDVLREKVATFHELDQLTDTLDQELPGMAKFFNQDLADQPLTPAAEAALERAAHIAGRWDGIDPVISNQISAIDNQLLEITHAPAVATVGDARDAWFVYSPTDTHAAQQALPLIDRDTTERLAGIAATSTSTPGPAEQDVTAERITSYPMSVTAALSAAPTTPTVPVHSSSAHVVQRSSLER